MGKGDAGKMVLVLMESLAGSGHKFATTRPKLADKLDMLKFDPRVRQHVIYREVKKIRTIKK